jgi:hypothetical protein
LSVPSGGADLDRDPVALVLGGLAILLAAAYAVAALLQARPAVRTAIVVLAAFFLIVLPTAGFVALGGITGRPYGQDGGVVQLPLAIDKILAGESPYGADYSDSILGKEARASDFWAPYGGNPILRHHAYLPGTHLLMLPFHLLGRGLFGGFDPRIVTLVAIVLAALVGARLVVEPAARLAALAVVLVNPLVYWHQIFGANDALVVALLLVATLLAVRQRPLAASAILGLACATKQLAWPFAPFLLAHVAGLRGFGELSSREGLERLARPLLVAAAVFAVVVGPVAALDFRRFWGDIFAYNVGLPGADNYPLGGTPGFGFANFLIYGGSVSSLGDYFPFGVFYALLIPLGLLLLRHQMRSGLAATALVTGSAALLASLFFSRVVHPNYLVIPAILLPLGLLAGERRPVDVVVVPLLLLGVAVEVAEHEVLRTTWEQALAVRLPQHVAGLTAALLPRAGPGLTLDPLGLLVSALAAGLAVAYLMAGLLSSSARLRLVLIGAALVVVVALPALVVVKVGEASGIVRGQHRWLATIVDVARNAGGQSALEVREAWSTSFRREPPRVLEPEPPAPGERGLAALLGTLRLFDPRYVLLLALAGAAAPLFRFDPGERPLAIGAALLSPFIAVGVPFAAPAILLVAMLLAAWALANRGARVAAVVVLGIAATFAPLVIVVIVVAWGLASRYWRSDGQALAAAGTALLIAFAVAPGVSAHAFALPGVLLLLATLSAADDR